MPLDSTDAMFSTIARKDRDKWWVPAVAQLQINLDNVRTNEEINRREGDIVEADSEKEDADSFMRAIKMMKTRGKGNG